MHKFYYPIIVLQGARHAFAEAGGKGIANPTAVLLAGCNMLRHLHLDYHAQAVEIAVLKVIKAGKVGFEVISYKCFYNILYLNCALLYR